MKIQQLLNTAWAALPVLLALLALRRASARELSRFADRYGISVTTETAPVLNRLIFRSRAARLIGAAVGLSLHPVGSAVGLSLPADGPFFGICGYLIGAFGAALVPSWPGGRRRSASLTPRSAAQYLPRTALLTPPAAVVVSVTATIVYALESRTSEPNFTGSSAGFVVAIVAAVATALAIRVVVRRPQPVMSSELTATDDAIRSQALHILAGAGLALALAGTSSALIEMGVYATNTWIHGIGLVAALVAGFGALTAWLFRSSPWLVRRTPTQ